MQSLALAAIGTVADVVPLLDENRILVEHGIRMLKQEPAPGLAELMRITKLDQASRLDTESISFTLAPRLNAAGRLGQAQLAIELLTIGPGERTTQLADYIHQLNVQRDTLQRSVYLAANKQAKEEFDIENDAAFVLAGVGWHQGVIGVVAGRLADKFARPVIVVSLDASGKPESVGSGRVGGTNINLYDALKECDDRLVRFGGHAAAAGITILEEKLNDFRQDFCEAISKQWVEKAVVPEITIDAEATFGQLTLEVVKQIETLAPFGAGNPRPVLCCREVTLDEPARKMGSGERHLTVKLRQGDQVVRAVAFGASEWCDELNQLQSPIEIVYRPVINEFRGYRNVEVHLIDWRAKTTDVGT
jgi:single-stranded-DNA-specific exonuclease